MKCNDFEYQMHHTAPYFLGEPLQKNLDDLFWQLMIFLKTKTQIAKYWKRQYIPSNYHIFSQDFFTLLKTWKSSSIACAISMSNVVLCLLWLYKCCKHSSSWVIYVSDQERPGATRSDQERPGATRSDQERPGPRNWRGPQVLGRQRSFGSKWCSTDHPPWSVAIFY